MKRLLFTLTAIAFINLCYSQSDFRKGYVITHAGDTVHGLVSFREGPRAFNSCVFKSSGEQEPVTYGPQDIMGYGFINDKVFESRDIALKDQSPATVFLEVLVRGLVTLYRVDDAFLVEKEGDELRQLINEQEIVNIKGPHEAKGREVLRSSNEHIKVLNTLLFDCVETRQAVSKARLSQRVLTKLIERYNVCMGAPSRTFKEDKPWFRVQPALVVGIAFSNLDFAKMSKYEHLSGSFDRSTALNLGISAELLSPRISERFSFHVGMLHSSLEYEGFASAPYLGGINRHYVTFEVSQLKVPLGLRYTFPARNFIPYINAGVSATFHLSSNSHWKKEWTFQDIIEIQEREALDIQSAQKGGWVGVGVVKPVGTKLALFGELRYERTDGLAKSAFEADLDFKSVITNFQIVFGLSLR